MLVEVGILRIKIRGREGVGNKTVQNLLAYKILHITIAKTYW